ncbi:P-loop NTPase family protein [Dinghuibacter silviterrae]|uniref:AAA+ ATPase domain-containing protein n=1 Tax=Dinghuibacter silviterrae TaxID=1539049 RepID=A0A4V3GLZ8_9BACT|nr:hypothetical protein [Dinghuibacter silviterrae]TDX01493.1 hypothetical protein EDB95_2529 [Dinghuibacter silviterrae]
MITIDNYFKEISSVDLSSLNDTLRKGHELLVESTENGTNLDNYYESDEIRRIVDLYLSELNKFLERKAPPAPTGKGKSSSGRQNSRRRKASVREHTATTEETRESISPRIPDMVERIPEELRFIRRFINMNGKSKTKEEILRFINSLQKSILEKRIRKTSAFAEQIRFIQDQLIDVYNSMKTKIKIELKPETLDSLKVLLGGQKIMPSINFIKRYISLNGKIGVKEQAKKLLEQINRAIEKGKITDSDSYIIEIHDIKKNLHAFVTGREQKTLDIEKATLNGLNGALGCSCQSKRAEKPVLMNSMDFAGLEFETIGLLGKWYDLIGDPSPGFTAMVFGRPKMGKSWLCVDFAGYLARNHGTVLFVAKEEGLDLTLQQKLESVKHPRLFVASKLPDDLTQFDFIVLDSVNKLGLTPEDLNRLREDNPGKSFIFIFQTTKAGNFRGANSFQHDVDVVIEVPEPGKAVQFGRFNQGGEMEIFDDRLAA